MKKRKLNVELLRKIQKHITEEPRRFFMQDYEAKAEDQLEWQRKRDRYRLWRQSDLAATMPPCGTAACIAGWANLLSGKINHRYTADVTAAKLLGVQSIAEWSKTQEKTSFFELRDHPLFVETGWPQPFRRRYKAAKTPRLRAKIACARIDHLIETGE